MNKKEITPLEALKDFYIFFKQCEIENKYDKQLTNHFLGLHNIIKQALEELDKINARLVVVNMKLNSKREECVKNMEYTDEDDFVHEAGEITMRCIDWVWEMLKEVLL